MLQVFLAGNLGRDAELKDINGEALASFSVAVTQRVKRQKQTTWIGCAIWGKRAAALSAFLTKGSRVAVSGELTTREHNGKTYLECRVGEITLLGAGSGGEAGESKPEKPATAPAGSGYDYGNSAGGDDEIPF